MTMSAFGVSQFSAANDGASCGFLLIVYDDCALEGERWGCQEHFGCPLCSLACFFSRSGCSWASRYSARNLKSIYNPQQSRRCSSSGSKRIWTSSEGGAQCPRTESTFQG